MTTEDNFLVYNRNPSLPDYWVVCMIGYLDLNTQIENIYQDQYIEIMRSKTNICNINHNLKVNCFISRVLIRILV